MKKTVKLLYFSILFFTAINFAYATPVGDNDGGRAKIWLSIPGAEEVGVLPGDPWLSESDLTHNSNFFLNVQNTADGTIFDAHLVLSIPSSTSTPNSWLIDLNSTPFDYPDFTNTGAHTYLSPHGVFWPEGTAKWTEYTIGDIGMGSTVSLPVSITNPTEDFLLHFDAYGSNSATSQNGWYFAPYSHDANYNFTPEPVSSVLFLLGGGAMALRTYRRKK